MCKDSDFKLFHNVANVLYENNLQANPFGKRNYNYESLN